MTSSRPRRPSRSLPNKVGRLNLEPSSSEPLTPSLSHSFVMMEIVPYLQACKINRLNRRGERASDDGGGAAATSETDRPSHRAGDLSCNGGTEQDATGDSGGTKQTNEERKRKSEVVVPSLRSLALRSSVLVP